ncbi:MAG: hypothetical protein EBR09_16830 [Proteobacteria bacterium]|nr:hypothetical protein [Pseudomonadota bacterium]
MKNSQKAIHLLATLTLATACGSPVDELNESRVQLAQAQTDAELGLNLPKPPGAGIPIPKPKPLPTFNSGHILVEKAVNLKHARSFGGKFQSGCIVHKGYKLVDVSPTPENYLVTTQSADLTLAPKGWSSFSATVVIPKNALRLTRSSCHNGARVVVTSNSGFEGLAIVRSSTQFDVEPKVVPMIACVAIGCPKPPVEEPKSCIVYSGRANIKITADKYSGKFLGTVVSSGEIIDMMARKSECNAGTRIIADADALARALDPKRITPPHGCDLPVPVTVSHASANSSDGPAVVQPTADVVTAQDAK